MIRGIFERIQFLPERARPTDDLQSLGIRSGRSLSDWNDTVGACFVHGVDRVATQEGFRARGGIGRIGREFDFEYGRRRRDSRVIGGHNHRPGGRGSMEWKIRLGGIPLIGTGVSSSVGSVSSTEGGSALPESETGAGATKALTVIVAVATLLSIVPSLTR